MAQNTQSGASGGGSTVDEMYSLRHPAHMRSSGTGSDASEQLGPEVLDEGVDAHAPLRILLPPLVDADGALAHIVVSDDQYIGNLLEPRLADARAERLVGLGPFDPEALAAQQVSRAHGVGDVITAHGQHAHLFRRQPEREGAGVVLDEDPEE